MKATTDLSNSPPEVIALVTRDGLPPWSSFYEEPLKMRGLAIRALVDPEDLCRIEQAVQTSSPEEIQELKQDIQRQVMEEVRDLEICRGFESGSPDQVAAMLSAIDATERVQLEINFYRFLYSTVTHLHQRFELPTKWFED